MSMIVLEHPPSWLAAMVDAPRFAADTMIAAMKL